MPVQKEKYKKQSWNDKKKNKKHKVSQVVAHPTHHEMTNATLMLRDTLNIH